MLDLLQNPQIPAVCVSVEAITRLVYPASEPRYCYRQFGNQKSKQAKQCYTYPYMELSMDGILPGIGGCGMGGACRGAPGLLTAEFIIFKAEANLSVREK